MRLDSAPGKEKIQKFLKTQEVVTQTLTELEQEEMHLKVRNFLLPKRQTFFIIFGTKEKQTRL